jgi:hypothetical protein
MTKEQAEEAAQDYEAEAAHWRREVEFAKKAGLPHANLVDQGARAARAALALRAHWPMREALEAATQHVYWPHITRTPAGKLVDECATAALALARKEP